MIFVNSDFQPTAINVKNFNFIRLLPFNWENTISKLGESSDMAETYKSECEHTDLWVAMNDTTIVVYLTDESNRKISLAYQIKKGWVTDFASVPKVLRGFVDNDATEIIVAAICHDIAYAIHGIPWEDANRLFKNTMDYYGMSELKEHLAYFAVSSPIGKVKWDDNTTETIEAEKQWVDISLEV